ncbi:MAG TPA: S8 family serine peptidase [Candidatus Blautia excrementipullorum]|nr:S8 family serine peptidase [Candidatus Blautia excrementipullorum]
MEDQKMDNLLNLALDSTEQERRKSGNLNVGYTEETGMWDVVVKYSGNTDELSGPGIRIVPLLGGYAVVTLPEEQLESFSSRPQIEFMEMPKRLYFQVNQGAEASCIRSVQREPGGEQGLSGRGVLIGIVDSGADYRHPDFCREDGTSRILKLWDQSASGDTGKPPEGYFLGTEYGKEEIDRALALPENEGRLLVPQQDLSGHGTSVLGIAAGNGRASGGIYRGAAYDSDIIAVKLGMPRENSFPRTTELMQGIDYLVRQALALRMPMAINLSFGNNYGSHRGDSLLETYMSNAANVGRTVICVGTGNNGNDNLHTSGQVRAAEVKEIEFGVSAYEPVLNVQLWKAYSDEMEIYIEAPSGQTAGPLSEQLGTQRYLMGNTEVLIYYGKPAPFQVTQEIYFDFIPRGMYIDSGVWKIRLRGRRVKTGGFYLWLPGGMTLNPGTGFYYPKAEETLTIPSAAEKVITVGAYDSRLNAFADFSGRGGGDLFYPKPDFAAPGVNITAPVPGGGYGSVTGTSFAVPFAAGAAALLMEWGIVRGNDPFLWGEKVKAYLRRGAQPLRGFEVYPNPEIGYGVLCLRNSIPESR